MSRQAVILAQGNELTMGLTVDTNSAWLAGRLWELGIEVRRVITAPDRLDELVDILRQAAGLAPVVIGTGGLGPTRDDLTAEAVGRAFGWPLELDAGALEQVHARFARMGRPMAAVNEKQAWLPRGATVLENRWGTAPGFAVEPAPGVRMAFLPGVPREMKPMFDTWLAPALRAADEGTGPTVHTIRVMGVPESTLEEWMREIEAPGLEIGFRAKLPEVHVKLRFGPEVPPGARQALVARARDRIGWRAFSVDGGDLAEVVGAALAARGETLALAESCTAGRLAAWLGGVPGASRYLLEGAVVYSNAAKVRTCGVPEALLAAEGAVSEGVARALAAGIRDRAGASWGLGITGIAGPDGGSPDKPVGTVHVALAGPGDRAEHHRFQLAGDRDRVQTLAAAQALAMLWRQLDRGTVDG